MKTKRKVIGLKKKLKSKGMEDFLFPLLETNYAPQQLTPKMSNCENFTIFTHCLNSGTQRGRMKTAQSHLLYETIRSALRHVEEFVEEGVAPIKRLQSDENKTSPALNISLASLLLSFVPCLHNPNKERMPLAIRLK